MKNYVFKNLDLHCTKCKEDIVSDPECWDNVDDVYFCPMCGQNAYEISELFEMANQDQWPRDYEDHDQQQSEYPWK